MAMQSNLLSNCSYTKLPLQSWLFSDNKQIHCELVVLLRSRDLAAPAARPPRRLWNLPGGLPAYYFCFASWLLICVTVAPRLHVVGARVLLFPRTFSAHKDRNRLSKDRAMHGLRWENEAVVNRLTVKLHCPSGKANLRQIIWAR